VKPEQYLDEVVEGADDFLEMISKIHARESIVITDNKATVKVGDNLKELFVDIKKTANTLKNLYTKTILTPRHAVTSTFLKYYRLISQNTKKIIEQARKILARLPKGGLLAKATELGDDVLFSFKDAINETLTQINSFIPDRNFHIDLVS
jgi:hypothetical protein